LRWVTQVRVAAGYLNVRLLKLKMLEVTILTILVITISPYLLIIILPFALFGIIEEIIKSNINKLLKLVKWLIEPWPLYVFAILVVLNLVALKILPRENKTIVSWSSAIFQIIGGVIILSIININMGILSKSSIPKYIFGYFKRFPLFRRNNIVLMVANCHSSTNCSTAELRLIPSTSDLKERIEFLYKEIDRIENKIGKLKTEINEKINESENKLHSEINTIKTEIKEINIKIQNVVIGGATWEVLGALSISYGLLIPLIHTA
jgi:hypothetical protein